MDRVIPISLFGPKTIELSAFASLVDRFGDMGLGKRQLEMQHLFFSNIYVCFVALLLTLVAFYQENLIQTF